MARPRSLVVVLVSAHAAVALGACTARPLDEARRLEAKGELRAAALAARAAAGHDAANMPAWDLATDLFCRRLGDVGECLATLEVELDKLGRLDRHALLLADALAGRARARLAIGLVEVAGQDLERAERFTVDHPPLLVARALWHRARGDERAARAALEQVLKLEPGHAEARALYGAATRTATATHTATKAATANPDEAEERFGGR